MMTDCSCGATFHEPHHHSSVCSYRKHGWLNDYANELLTLLDRIELEENVSLARQRFDIAEKYGMTVAFREPISDRHH